MTHTRILKALLPFRKTVLFLLFVVYYNYFYSQENNSVYFPQEQIILEECINTIPDDCIYEYLKNKLEERLLSNKKILTNYKNKDTIKLNLTFRFTNQKKIDFKRSYLYINNKKARKKIRKEEFITLPKFKLINIKPDLFTTSHVFNFTYKIVKNKKNLEAVYIDLKKKYSGGVIEEPPIFPGCENLSFINTRICLNKSFSNHIKEHFRYPPQALRKKIEGRVLVNFKIDEQGLVTEIKTNKANMLLKQEAIRIISLLPKMIPGKINGEPVKVPFSIPINFKLN